jgi:hypothetical protein
VSVARGNDHGSAQRAPALAQLQRDAVLKRLRWARAWMIAGAAALTAGFAALVSAILPGKTLAARAEPKSAVGALAAARGGAVQRMPPLASPSTLGLQGPAQPPQSSPAQPPQPSQSSPAQPSQSPTAQPQATAPSPAAPSSAPAAAPSDGGGAVVSGGS